MGLKLDMSTAYDKIEWDFVLEMLNALGFHKKIISKLKQCITSVSYSILLNDSPFEKFTPTRGLR